MELAHPCLDAPVVPTKPPKYLSWHRRSAIRALAPAAIVGISVQQVGQTHIVGVAGCTMVAAAGLGLLVSGPVDRSRVVWVTLALGLAPWLAVRSSPWLIVPTLAAMAGVLVLAASASGPWPTTFPAIGRNGAALMGAGFDAPRQAFRVAGALAPGNAREQLRGSLLGIGVAAAVGVVLVALLASGDAFFASLVGAPAIGARIRDAFVVAVAGVIWFPHPRRWHHSAWAGPEPTPRHEVGAKPPVLLVAKSAARQFGRVISATLQHKT